MSQSWHDRNRKSCLSCGELCHYAAKHCKSCTAAARRIPTLDRLTAKTVVTKSGCWEFVGFRLPNGYGRIMHISPQPELAHRVSWMIHHGDIPSGLIVCHKCDNPPCWNPNHLFLGTHSDNAQDMVSKGRDKHPETNPKKQGILHHNSKLTRDQVLEIRSRKNEPRKVLAAEFGLSVRYTSTLICGLRWRHLNAPVPLEAA